MLKHSLPFHRFICDGIDGYFSGLLNGGVENITVNDDHDNQWYTEIDGKKINELVKDGKITQEKLNQIVERTKKGGAEIVKYLEKGSAFYAPAASGIEMAESYLKDQKKQLPCAVYLNGEYGAKNIYAGVPVIIGSGGVEKIIEIELSSEEKENFKKSIKSVQDLYSAAQKIDKTL